MYLGIHRQKALGCPGSLKSTAVYAEALFQGHFLLTPFASRSSLPTRVSRMESPTK